ncbi:cell division cycle and apoptosis regulator protein 1-like isoform X2 [Leucoraja erinacea]|uniref:cell division cycle and apoptosis regulator protein 1-like isoform X2 n=1 Tax=Leucoraja erinaceus TaxID=7782 RepID=UPI002457E6D3|nr:cell division cycle and apoptosis regulator protein 1-like isoform X2 [Leucoraja erinacea]
MWGNQFQSASKSGSHGGQQQSLLGPGPPSMQQALLQNPSHMMSGQKQGILGAKPQPQPLLQARIPSLLSSQPLLSQLPHKPGLLQPLVHLGPHGQLGRRMDMGMRSMGRNGRMDMGRRGDRRDNYKRMGQGSHKRYQDMASGEGPAKKARHYIPSYNVQYSRFCLDSAACDTIEVQRRYPCLNIPDTFFDGRLGWVNTFPLTEPFQLGQKSVFHVMEKGLEPTEEQDGQMDPPDADSTYSAKVILLSCPDLLDLYRQTCTMAEAPKERAEPAQHATKLIKFLVGMKGQEEAMAIGGSWSPSLDGLGPDKDPRVLIKTAIRTTKFLTGIDLSVCTQWFRFAEIRYLHPGELCEGRLLPARVETVVVFLPDVWHCLPTRLEWDALSLGYTQQLTDREQAEHKDTDRDEAEEKMEEQGEDAPPTPTQWSHLDLKSMKVEDFRRELKARNMNWKGTKAQLVSRLEKELEEETAKEEMEKDESPVKEAESVVTPEPSPDEEQKQDAEEKQPEEAPAAPKVEPRCPLPAEPAVIVTPNVAAMGGNFGCAVLSLSNLRSYRIDSKGHSFEVLWLAEIFSEMLQRDFGYAIYSALLAYPEKKPEEVPEKPKAATGGQEQEQKDQDMEQDEKPKEAKGEGEEMENAELKDSGEEAKESSDALAKTTAMEEDDNWEWELTKPEEGENKEKETKGKEADDDSLLQMDDVLFLEDNEEDFGIANAGEKKAAEKSNEAESAKETPPERDVSQMVTLRKDLLLAFAYFDRNLCSYLMEKDLELILSTVGLHITRSQIRQLLGKVCSQNMCLYRTLTDGWEGDLEKMEDKSLVPADMVLGNHHLLPTAAVAAVGAASKARLRSADGSLVEHNGNMVNVGNLIQKLERDERNRADMEHKLHSVESQLAEAVGKVSSNVTVNKSLTTKIEDTQKQVTELEDRVKTAEKLKIFYELRLQDNTRNLNSMLEEIQRIIKKNNALTEKDK